MYLSEVLSTLNILSMDLVEASLVSFCLIGEDGI